MWRVRSLACWGRSCALLALAGLLLSFLLYPKLVRQLGGAWQISGPEWQGELSPETGAFLSRHLEGLDTEKLVDVHTHLAGIGTGGSGCEVHPHMRSWASPLAHMRFDLYLSAAGIQDLENADHEFAARLGALIENSPLGGRFCLLAFDRAYHEDGRVDPEHSEFHVPNEWVYAMASESPERFIPVISVHPYRKDALVELERWAERGVRLVKWLPNGMGMDPASALCDDYYDKLVELDIALLTHTGMEMAIDAEERQALGNPLRLRRALDRGVRVIAAHCASLGDDLDLDAPPAERKRVRSFDLFLRMMDEPRYEGLLFGEISALTQRNRLGVPLETLLERRDLHHRLVNGSDYPLPALNAVIHLAPLVKGGFLDGADGVALKEIYSRDPIVFDLLLKRSLRSPETGEGFSREVFELPEVFGL